METFVPGRVITRKAARVSLCASIFLIAILVTGCASIRTWLPFSGPSGKEVVAVQNAGPEEYAIQVVEVTDAVTRELFARQQRSLFSETLGDKAAAGYVVGPGDVLEVFIWEAPPATLFGPTVLDPKSGIATARVTALPEQMVSSDGTINVPFAGDVPVAFKSPQQIEAEIVKRLKQKANQPQVMVTVVRNATSSVTVVGEVASSTRMPLTAKGERLLDALAAAGGVRQPVDKMMVQITRGHMVQALPLGTVIRDPRQNIQLQPGDVITALFQPLSFNVLGATTKNEEINFEAQGISLAQALARSGGLQDMRADARGVFIFRFEKADALTWQSPPRTTPDGRIPVIYRFDLKEPAAFFVAQSFQIQNQDVLYVSNAPGADFQKFLNLVTSVAYPVLTGISVSNTLHSGN
ncbi:MAG: polysaccharide biosynthesis/export family protein [Dissulfurispiraceae bacterium]